jgi:hypothetical protein
MALNIEGIQPSPVLAEDDDLFPSARWRSVSDSGLIADTTPPFGLYLANFDQIQPLETRSHPMHTVTATTSLCR